MTTTRPWLQVKGTDPDVFNFIEAELTRQRNELEMIASENFASPEVMAAMSSVFTNKYAEGLPHKRYYGGCHVVDGLEDLAIDRLKKVFGCEYANVQPHSGAQANAAAFLALLKTGDKILGMDLSHGGHLTHGSHVNFSGMIYEPYFYGVDEKSGKLDYDQIAKKAQECRPKLIIAGASAYSREIDFKKFREIADAVDAYLMVDMAHIAGLVAAKLHPDPVPYAHVITSTTHKTLRGPRGGIILWNDKKLNFNKAVFPGTQGGPLEHIIAAKAVCFAEALKPQFVDYQKMVIANSLTLANSLIDGDMKLVSGGTDNHLVLVDLSDSEVTGKVFEKTLGEIGITANKNTVPGEKRSPFVTSGLRLGTPALTSRGLLPAQMKEIGEIIVATFKMLINESDERETLRGKVQNICQAFPLYKDWN